MRLASWIRANTDQIIGEWERFAATLTPAASHMSSSALRNHIRRILEFTAADIESPQTESEQTEKSKGGKDKPSAPSAAETHAALRLAGGFDLNQMVSEFRALRASVTRLWEKQLTDVERHDIADLTRFGEAMDQQVAEAIYHYSKKFSESKDLFLGILSHDLRSPLGAITRASQLALMIGPVSDRQEMLLSQIIDSAKRATELLAYLLDLTRARLASGLPAVREPMDMAFVSRKLVDEARILYPDHDFKLEISGDLTGEWDKARIAQFFANLLGNAAQYSFSYTCITINVQGRPDEVTVSIHNEGEPIPPEAIGGIFDSFTRTNLQHGKDHPASTNLGLGLYITKEIVTAHGGTISVTSSEEMGTTFTAHFPRYRPVREQP